MKTHKIIDPVQRMEGHMGLDIVIEDKRVVDAKVVGPLYRGFEKIMLGRHYGDAQVLPVRICGICPMVHTVCASKAIEALFLKKGVVYAPNLRPLRNIAHASHMIADHILHFYHLSLLDYVKGPDKAPFLPRYTGDYRLEKKLNEKVFSHYVQALDLVRRFRAASAVIAGKIPHAISFVPGGCTVVPNKTMVAEYKEILAPAKEFFKLWMEDMQVLKSHYQEYDGKSGIGVGVNNFMSMGVFEEDNTDSKHLFERGARFEGKKRALATEKIVEDVTHTWQDGESRMHPFNIDTKAVNPYKKEGYSYITAPTLEDEVVEVGPIARLIVEGSMHSASVMDRHLARVVSSQRILEACNGWLEELHLGQSAMVKVPDIPDGEVYGFSEAPRGACSHWVRVKNQHIERWQSIPATNWNAAPKNFFGKHGAIEQALINTPVEDSNNPFEALRVVRSFDPCMACTVHAIDTKGEKKRFFAKRFGEGL